MVRIINYQKRQTEEGKPFFVLEIQSGIEMVLSTKTGQYYATAKKANISSTFDEETCKALLGTDMRGNIRKMDSEPYEYTVRETGEIIMLTHRYVYQPEINNPIPTSYRGDSFENDFATKVETFSRNSHLSEMSI
jgi:predicted nucleotide-binding protein (sugar kinase/HSP70/actin superfamily)